MFQTDRVVWGFQYTGWCAAFLWTKWFGVFSMYWKAWDVSLDWNVLDSSFDCVVS